ncbi:proteasome inhibitor PI31 subunit-like [Centruroides sculpturatus]|uniref:proteasome inhibitor PI31 subunit-like n=1 Tax=Centruroides sculpturatus TaxID=218467 RepID=UPI000C6E9CED|nr:proteasome inhibitor PI31 subunit-like [Centruroides sculpturatus]
MKALELCHTIVKNQIKQKSDAFMVFLHCFMIEKGIKCVSSGKTWSSDEKSELLPENWNSQKDSYNIRYMSTNNHRYILNVKSSGNSIRVKLENLDNKQSSRISFDIDNFINEDFKNFHSAFKNLNNLEEEMDKMFREIRSPEINWSGRTKDSDTTSTHKRNFSVPEIGGNDLDPLGRGGGSGGMLMSEPRPAPPDPTSGNLDFEPEVRILPEMRFDPIGPDTKAPKPPKRDPDRLI